MKNKVFGSRRTKGDIVFDTLNYIILALIVVITLYPFLNTLAISFNDSIDAVRGGIYLWPRKFTLFNYKNILSQSAIYHATFISVLRAFIGCIFNVFASLVVAYAISKKEFVLRGFYSRIFIFSMYFSGGLIPSYFLIKGLGLTNNFLVYILPGIVSAWNIMVVRSYIDGLPKSIIESASMDGASEIRIIFSIIFPLSLPVLATITLFVAVGQWNSWFDTMLYCSSKQSLSTLQFELQKVLQSSASLQTQANMAASKIPGAASNTVTPASVRATMTVIAVVPILLVYPYLQKYFVTGLTLGGVKG
ncbi:carbohydrate ABC transporter permease [Clostridium oryzae]|uniref:L-arabinose transport system permease protein AraQ n=1 Tax=Clostridium oryzae TaxID=1450648 RepID=A0A1V4I9Q4_9CLOT|nr:carbohydrate ABC transporter permease [Clostridium oryzae]OPJ56610.1 L-arabinose transport system permease protein AraQ [Clostridium oryzae]